MAGTAHRPVRVAFVGNVANSMYRVASALRDDPDIEPHLYVGRNDGATARPESADPSLAAGYPDWIHEGAWVTAASVLAPWRAPITRELRRYDLVVATGPGPIFAQFAGVPWCWYVTGGDLTVKPFPIEFRSWYPSWKHRAGELVGGAWQRRAARRADRLWIQPFAPMLDAADRIGIDPARLSDRYLPLPVDVEAFQPPVEPAADAAGPSDELVTRMRAARLAIFHPSRLVMEADPKLVRTGQWKGNDTLIRGVAELVGRGEGDGVLLVMPDSTLSRDVLRAKALVAELGITANVAWAEPPAASGFAQHELRALYAAADVVCDEFGVGWFGYVSLEGMAMGKAVVSNVDEGVLARLYPDGHPWLSAATPLEVADRLRDLAADPSAARRSGEAGRAWVVANHGPAAVRSRYHDAVAELVADLLA